MLYIQLALSFLFSLGDSLRICTPEAMRLHLATAQGIGQGSHNGSMVFHHTIIFQERLAFNNTSVSIVASLSLSMNYAFGGNHIGSRECPSGSPR